METKFQKYWKNTPMIFLAVVALDPRYNLTSVENVIANINANLNTNLDVDIIKVRN